MINDFHVHLGKSSSGSVSTADDLIRSMDHFGIERSGLSLLNGVNAAPLNDIVRDCVQQHPDRLVGFAVINPREEDAVMEVKRCLDSGLFRGIKFHSWKHGYYPENNGNLDAVLDAVEPYDVPVLCHTGTAPLSVPQQWAAVAARHPGVTFVFAHIGLYDFGYSCVECAQPLPNVCVDTSGQHEIPVIKKALSDLGADRVLFATDWPYKYPGSEIGKFEAFEISDEDREKIFYSNAKRLWKIESLR